MMTAEGGSLCCVLPLTVLYFLSFFFLFNFVLGHERAECVSGNSDGWILAEEGFLRIVCGDGDYVACGGCGVARVFAVTFWAEGAEG